MKFSATRLTRNLIGLTRIQSELENAQPYSKPKPNGFGWVNNENGLDLGFMWETISLWFGYGKIQSHVLVENKINKINENKLIPASMPLLL